MLKIATVEPLPEIAYYYPNATWRVGSSDFIKNLLLYFDGVGILVPNYLRDKPFAQDPDLAPTLKDRGLLHLLTPEEIIDKNIAEKLATSVTNILVTGALDDLSRDGRDFHELSYSRLGSYGDAGLAEMLFQEFERRGLATKSVDGSSIPMHPVARTMVLVLLAQILRANSAALGFELCPTTDRPEMLSALEDILNIPQLPTAGQVVSMDIAQVGVDVSGVPIEQVLEFRRRHGSEYQRYARDVRMFARSLRDIEPHERNEALMDRKADLVFRAGELARQARSYWRRPTAIFLSLLGAASSLSGATAFGAAFAVGGALASAGPSPTDSGGAYSYLFKSRRLQV